MKTEILKVFGMMDESVANKLSSTLLTIKGVSDVVVSISEGNATVQFDEHVTSLQELQAAMVRAGYDMGAGADAGAGAKTGGCCGGCGGSRC